MNREVLLELLSHKDRTFREVSASTAAAVRDEVGRRQVLTFSRVRPASESPASVDLDTVKVEDIPEVALRLEHAHLYVVSAFVGADDQWVDEVATAVGGLSGLDAAVLDRLVAERRIDEVTARRVGLASAVYEATERDTTLTRMVLEARLSVSEAPARSTLDLASTSPDEWRAALSAIGPSTYNGRSILQIASTLADRFAAMHPGTAFVARLGLPAEVRLRQLVEEVEPLLERNPDLFVRSGNDLDLQGIDGDQVTKAVTAHLVLRSLISRCPDLHLEKVLPDRALSPDARASIAARRIGYVQQFQRAVGEERVLSLDYGPRSSDLAPLVALGASAEELAMVRRTLKTHQRAFALGGTADAAAALLAHGLTSARAVSRLGVAQLAARVGEAIDAAALHERATRLASDAAIVAASLLDLVDDPIAHTSAGNVPPSSLDYLRELDGFEQLFGSLSFCACEECNSILGPAAYFVDLMRFVDEQARPQFAAHPGHPLDLKTRRPDLWTLPLTCANTRDRVPVLEIVDEILEGFLARATSLTGSVEEQRRRVYEALASEDASFALPYDLASTRADRYLAVHSVTRSQIARVVGLTPGEWASRRLTLTPVEVQLVTTPDLDIDHHRARYGVSFQLVGSEVEPVDVQDLRRHLAVDREELSTLLATQYVRGSGTAPRIVAEKRSPESVQNDIERVHGLTVAALDRIHRLVRLHAHVPWTLVELDEALSAFALDELNSEALLQVARLLEVQERWSLDIDDAQMLVATPAQAWFGRTFGTTGGVLPDDTRMFIHPSFRDLPAADPMQSRLATALGTSADDLARAIRTLAPHLARANATGFDPRDPDEQQRGFLLSAANLSLLTRQVRIARLFEVSIPQLEQLCSLAGVVFPVPSAEALLALGDVESWRRSSGYTLDDVAVALGQQPLDSATALPALSIAQRVVDGAGDELMFESSLFALSTGISEAGSRAILEANAAQFARIGDRWRILADADLSALVMPASAIVSSTTTNRLLTVGEVQEVLASFVPAAVFARRLATALSVPADKLRAISAVAGANLADPALARALTGGAIAPLEALIGQLRPFVIAVQHERWTAAAIDHVARHRAVYGVSGAVTLQSLHSLAVVTSALETADADDVAAVLEGYTAQGFAPSTEEALSRVVGVDVASVRALRTLAAPGLPAAIALATVLCAAHLARQLQIDGAVLAPLVSTDATALSAAVDALIAATRSSISSETLAKIEQQILESRRDALAAMIVDVLRPDAFRDLDDLSAYFLVDVRSGGCQTSSRVTAATSSVQQYVHRLIMRLEQDRRAADDPAHLEVGLSRHALDEWSWRKNYRVWEANRKVFLWPENYLEPDLRDDKTPLFVELEQELLQGAVTEQTVLDAYSKYLAGFEELASLTIAGAYHDIASGVGARDTLHLFGVSSADPPTFYYRTCENLSASTRDASSVAVWTPWRKLNVQVSGRRVSPVVFDGRLHVFWTDYKTRSRTKVVDGGSEFDGYQHTMRLRFTTLRLDGTWTPPQDVTLPGWDRGTDEFVLGRGILHDWFITFPPGTPPRPRFAEWGAPHPEALDDYTVRGPNWDWVWLEPVRLAKRDGLFIRYRNFLQSGEIDLFSRELVRTTEPKPRTVRPEVLCARGNALFYGSPIFWNQSLTAVANLVIESERIDRLRGEDTLGEYFKPGLYQGQVATFADKANLLALPGNVEDAIAQVGNDVILLQGSVTRDHSYVARRIGTTLATRLARTLFSDGVDGLLDVETQKTLREAGLPLTPTGGLVIDRSNRGTLDFKGPYGTYFREVFFHVPALLANHLNSQGQFASAQRWYQYIFDPTATEVISVPATAPPLERERMLRDRVWRYLELRGLDPITIRSALTDPAALEKYRRDPFNPHAIARLRITAYQKAIVMRYVDNLLDWGDHLFTQFTMESVNEAVMLYLTAQNILGARPAELGPCGEAGETPRTYERIAAQLVGDGDLLLELENFILHPRLADRAPSASSASAATSGGATHAGTVGALSGALHRPALFHAIAGSPLHGLHGPLDAVLSEDPDVDYGAPTSDASFSAEWNRAGLDAWSPALAKSTSYSGDIAGGRPSSRVRDARTSEFAAAPASTAVVRGHTTADGGRAANATSYADFLLDSVPAFCVPPNTELHAYWDRLDDRLFKIRHCMDITGQLRELALTEAPIDPRLLIHGVASGADFGEIANGMASSLPPYRFAYLIERAKSYAATLQGFGAAMLGALEKKDAEEMSRLSIVHQKNIAGLSTRLRTLDLEVAEETLTSTQLQRDAAVMRRDFYQGLLDEGNNGWEVAERIARHYAAVTHTLEGELRVMSSVATALPQVGSVFAMKYGGVELGGALGQAAAGYGALALIAEAAAGSAALEGGYVRRNEGWRHQRDLARRDVEIFDRQVSAATRHVKLAERSLVIHQRQLEQLEQVSDLLASRFSNLGRLTWLSQQLQRLYRDAYDSAMAIARLAEQAYRFERDEDPAPGLAASYWDAGQAGLLAGERLLIGLQQLERRFLETHERTHEIEQPISLGQVDPAALVRLRETGSCEFSIPELAYDLFYPGHYKRRIKGVRLTIPCITGPYVNVSATLELLGSQLRRSPAAGQALLELPPRRTTSIATSTAQNDGGVFEMTFRDERYLPFEGAGAVSSWRLSLPATFRPFDYSTITDAILSISYTASFDGALRGRVESTNAALEGSLLHYVRTHPLTRVFSLRQDFSAVFTRLLRSPLSTEVRFEITDRHFPLFAQGKPLRDVTATLVLRTKDNLDPGAFVLEVDGDALGTWNPQDALGHLRGAALSSAFSQSVRPATHALRVTSAGSLAPPSVADGGVDVDKLLDVLLVVEYAL